MMQRPRFINDTYFSHVCQLCKAIYKLKQVPHTWYNELKEFLFFFSNSYLDQSLFIYNVNGILIHFLVYVDDLLVIGNYDKLMRQFSFALSQWFFLKDLVPLYYFLGVQVIPTTQGMFLSQHKYICDLLLKTKMDGTKEAFIPMSSTSKVLTHNDGQVATNATDY